MLKDNVYELAEERILVQTTLGEFKATLHTDLKTINLNMESPENGWWTRKIELFFLPEIVEM